MTPSLSELDDLEIVADELQQRTYVTVSDDDVLALARGLERHRRRMVAVEHAVVAEIVERQLAAGLGARSTAALLAELLTITPAEAAGRIRAAALLGPRRSYDGRPLEPLHAVVARAQAAGELSPQQARVVTDCVSAVPEGVADLPAADDDGETGAADPATTTPAPTVAEAVESLLVEQARTLDPTRLRHAADRVIAHLDPDGSLRDPEYRHRRRAVRLRRRPDGSAHLEGETDAELTELLATVLDHLAVPRHTAEQEDTRSREQRCHDALRDLCRSALRAGTLPDNAGTAATVVLHMTGDDYLGELGRCFPGASATPDAAVAAAPPPPSTPAWVATAARTAPRTPLGSSPPGLGAGWAVTGHGQPVRAREALRWAGADHAVFAVAFGRAVGSIRPVTGYGSSHRIFTARQRLAMAARDRGCTFPGCSAPPALCEAMHFGRDHAAGGATDLSNGALGCSYHHRHHVQSGWEPRMIAGVPHWVPPRWIDPERRPRRNTVHHVADLAAALLVPATSPPQPPDAP